MRNSGNKNLLIWLLLAICSGGLVFGKTHQVRKSETCFSIAKKYGVTVKALMSANKIRDARYLRLGQRIVIPSKKVKKSTTRRVATKSSRTQSSAVRRATSKKLRVVIDPGHGGRDKGAIWGGVRESDLNMLVARRVEYSLKKKGYSVTMTRRSDRFISLSRRADIANRYRNCVFVSIHFNATYNTRVRGAETFYAGKRGKYLAQCIQSQLVKNLRVRNRGVRYRRFAVLRRTNCPAVLVECGFISNSYERARCRTARYQSLSATSIVAGIERYDRRY